MTLAGCSTISVTGRSRLCLRIGLDSDAVRADHDHPRVLLLGGLARLVGFVWSLIFLVCRARRAMARPGGDIGRSGFVAAAGPACRSYFVGRGIG